MARRTPHLVYFATRKHSRKRDVKIGITVDLKRRMGVIRGNLIFAVECSKPDAATLEKTLHKTFDLWRQPGTEWFTKNDPLWNLITSVLRLGYWPWDRSPIIRGEGW